MSDFILTITSGTIGGLIVLLFQRFWDFNDQKKQKVIEELKAKDRLVISAQQHLKVVEPRIVEHLLPGTSLDKAKTLLGAADYITQSNVMTNFSDDPVFTNTYYFKFRNAHILITSEDNQSIDSVTISSYMDPEHPIEYYHAGSPSNELGKMKFIEDDSSSVRSHIAERTMMDAYFGIQLYYGRGGQYLHYTLFGNDRDRVLKHQEDNNIAHLNGGIINSYCISSKEDFAPYISLM